ncbi:MAG: type II toxin-antitoxin system HicA family toxin [Nitrospira sp.]|nr:type II toxin-antitoxin system HicA family toxin [Nitrospira sp.]
MKASCNVRLIETATVLAYSFHGLRIDGVTGGGKQAGFVNRGGKGSHRNFVHPKATKPVTISGKPGEDAKHYQVRAVQLAIEEAKK